MISAWFLGWSVWTAAMGFAADWDEIRAAARLFVLNGITLTAAAIAFRDTFVPGRGSAVAFTVALVALTVVMVVFHQLQEARRPVAPEHAATAS
jgi:hypothetical protein